MQTEKTKILVCTFSEFYKHPIKHDMYKGCKYLTNCDFCIKAWYAKGQKFLLDMCSSYNLDLAQVL